MYHYATSATYQLSGGSPPPPAPPSPPKHGQIDPNSQYVHSHGVPHGHGGGRRMYSYEEENQGGFQKSFTDVVYQPASLHEVDDPNQVDL